MRASRILLAGLAVVAGALAVALSRTDERRASPTAVQAQTEVGRVTPGARACQADERLGDGARALRVGGWVEGDAGARLRVELDGRPGGEPLDVAPAPAAVALPLADGRTSDDAVELCLVNEGPDTLVLAGSQTGPEHQLTLVGEDGRRSRGAGRVRLEALRSERPASLWSVLGELPGRFATATGSALAPWLAIGGALVALVALFALLWRGDDPEQERADAS